MRLYELTNVYSQLENAAAEETDDASFIEMLDNIQAQLKEKATNVAMVIQNLEATAVSIRTAEKRMAERRKILENRAESIRKYVLTCMVRENIHAIECDYFVLKVRDNPQSVVIDDVTKIPAEYLVPQDPLPDKRAILDDIKQGCVIDGVHTERSQRLEIK